MAIDIFSEARRMVSAEDAARLYGVRLDRHGRALCPFHNDRHPSMTFKNGYFRCWSCGAAGSAIDLTARLFGLDALGAVKRLNGDFHLGLKLDKPLTPEERRTAQAAAERRRDLTNTQKMFDVWREQTMRDLNAVYHMAHTALVHIETPEDLTPGQAMAIQWQPWAEHTADVLAYGGMSEQMQVFRDREEVTARCRMILRGTPTRSGVA